MVEPRGEIPDPPEDYGPLRIQVKIEGSTPEVQLMGALEQLCERHMGELRSFPVGTNETKVKSREVARAVSWLHAKYKQGEE